MLKLAAVISKELRLLLRDRAGLLLLFLMPAVLVVVITLVQQNVMELTGQCATDVALLDLDRGALGDALRRELAGSRLRLVEMSGGEQESLREQVRQGTYQAGIILAAGTSERLHQILEQSMQAEAGRLPAGTKEGIGVELVFDPGIMAALRDAVRGRLSMALGRFELERKLAMLDTLLSRMLGGATPFSLAARLADHGQQEPLLHLKTAKATNPALIYNPVQQNVAAWAIFGIFFTAVPIAGALLKERDSGIWLRLRVLPVSPLTLFSGKALAFTLVSCCQFGLIALLGALLFPLLGLPAFSIAANPSAVLLVVIAAGISACSYGILLGMTCSSHEQASTLGATGVVAAAAIGGVMVPVHAMPRLMQQISHVSPLNWALTALQELIMRGEPVTSALDDIAFLLAFSLLLAVFSWRVAKKRASG